MKNKFCVSILGLLFLASGCHASRSPNPPTPTDSKTPVAKSSSKGLIASGMGVEKEKPESGKGNVQGKVFYNEKPAENIQVKLCETFNQFIGGCGGEIYTAITDKNGEYLIKNVPPRVYEGLTAKVFNSDYYIFITSGIVSAAKYKIDADRTFFAPDTNLFKNDLKLLNPQAGAKIAASPIEIKWDAYPDADYYKFSVSADLGSGAKTDYDFIGKRVAGLSYTLDRPLAPGVYNCKVQAYNAHNVELAESSNDIQFTVNATAAAPAGSPGPGK